MSDRHNNLRAKRMARNPCYLLAHRLVLVGHEVPQEVLTQVISGGVKDPPLVDARHAVDEAAERPPTSHLVE
jgi:hypothetical protein